MPTLRRYVPNSSKTGYYIQANVGAGAPITLQVSRLAGKIFTDNGYSDGDTVPTKLVWAMYDVGLLSTGGSGGPTKSVNVYSAFTENGVSARLSEQTRSELLEYFEDYCGPQQSRVRRLSSKLSRTQKYEDFRSQADVKTSDLGYGVIDSIRHIWRYVVTWFKSRQRIADD